MSEGSASAASPGLLTASEAHERIDAAAPDGGLVTVWAWHVCGWWHAETLRAEEAHAWVRSWMEPSTHARAPRAAGFAVRRGAAPVHCDGGLSAWTPWGRVPDRFAAQHAWGHYLGERFADESGAWAEMEFAAPRRHA